MLADLNGLENGQELGADLLIVGAGAAGITLALEFAGTQHRVVLAESGDLDLDRETQELCDGEVAGLAYEPLQATRARYLGGTTNMWTGWCKPLDRIDLQPRPWLGLAGWPIDREALQPYYERAQPVLEAGPYRYDIEDWVAAAGPLDDFSAAAIRPTFWQKSPPTRFGSHYREALHRAANVTVLLNANLVGMTPGNERGAIESAELRSLAGRSVLVRPRCVVLAAGGLENPRLLLAAAPGWRRVLGNDHDQVGRCFMDHPWWEVGTIYPSDPYDLVDRYYRHIAGGQRFRMGLSFTEAEQERLGVQNCCVELTLDRFRDGGIAAAGGIWRDLRHGHVPAHLGERVLSVLGDIGGVAEGAWRKLVLHRMVNRPVESVTLAVDLDPKPDPRSRVSLGEERDALGMPRLRLDWQLGADDERSMALLARRFADEVTRLGLGRVRLHSALQEPTGGWARAGNLVGHGASDAAPTMHISWHHVGTTRMSASPRDGVVDANCRVHGTPNLFVAGSSVFPTAGSANPTLTIVALAIRLADHLKQIELTPATATVPPSLIVFSAS